MRMFNQLRFRSRIRKRIPKYRFFLPDNSGYIPRYGIDHNRCSNLTARQDEITDRNFRRREMLDDAFIDAFVTAANQNHLLGLRQSQRFGLIEPSSGCAQHDNFGLLALSNRLHSFEDRFRLEDHSFTAAE